jgi:hypothetical protein
MPGVGHVKRHIWQPITNQMSKMTARKPVFAASPAGQPESAALGDAAQQHQPVVGCGRVIGFSMIENLNAFHRNNPFHRGWL